MEPLDPGAQTIATAVGSSRHHAVCRAERRRHRAEDEHDKGWRIALDPAEKLRKHEVVIHGSPFEIDAKGLQGF